jgi:ankyrin repeat protein
MATDKLELIFKEQNIDELNKYIADGGDVSSLNLAQILSSIFRNNLEKSSKFKIHIDKANINIEFIEILIKHNINLNTKSKSGFTAFIIALLFGIPKLTKLFIENGIDINEKVEFELIGTLCAYSNETLVGIQPPDIMEENHKFYEKVSVGSFAFYNYNRENIKLLLENNLDINSQIFNIHSLLSKDANGSDPKSLVYILSEQQDIDLELFQLFLTQYQYKNDIDVSIYSLLKYKHFDIIRYIINRGYTLKVRYGCFEKCIKLYLEDSEYYFDKIKFLLENKVQSNINSILRMIVSSPKVLHMELVKLLIKYGADVNFIPKENINTKKNDDKSLLMLACEEKSYNNYGNKFDLVKLLIENGANIHYKDNSGNTVLMLLADSDIDIFNSEKSSPSYNILNLLIDKGANIDATNNLGMTALMIYASKPSLYENRLSTDYAQLVQVLIDRGANTTITSSLTAYDLATNDELKQMLKNCTNNKPQALVKLLKNFTIDKPLKYTTHSWDFVLKDEHKDFDGFIDAITNNFNQIENELKELSPNLHKKIKAFLFETDSNSSYSWYSKSNITISWLNLDGLKEHCYSGNNPFDFKFKKPIKVNGKTLKKFADIINLFKQEIEVRSDFKTLRNIFDTQKKKLDEDFIFEPSKSKLDKQFYTDTHNLSIAIDLIFGEINKIKDHKTIEVKTKELDDSSIEIYITQKCSASSKSANELLKKVEDKGGDLYNIKNNLMNLCDWSVEGSYENEAFRINFLHSNNVKDIVKLEEKPDGFTHILKFYR